MKVEVIKAVEDVESFCSLPAKYVKWADKIYFICHGYCKIEITMVSLSMILFIKVSTE